MASITAEILATAIEGLIHAQIGSFGLCDHTGERADMECSAITEMDNGEYVLRVELSDGKAFSIMIEPSQD